MPWYLSCLMAAFMFEMIILGESPNSTSLVPPIMKTCVYSFFSNARGSLASIPAVMSPLIPALVTSNPSLSLKRSTQQSLGSMSYPSVKLSPKHNSLKFSIFLFPPQIGNNFKQKYYLPRFFIYVCNLFMILQKHFRILVGHFRQLYGEFFYHGVGQFSGIFGTCLYACAALDAFVSVAKQFFVNCTHRACLYAFSAPYASFRRHRLHEWHFRRRRIWNFARQAKNFQALLPFISVCNFINNLLSESPCQFNIVFIRPTHGYGPFFVCVGVLSYESRACNRNQPRFFSNIREFNKRISKLVVSVNRDANRRLSFSLYSAQPLRCRRWNPAAVDRSSHHNNIAFCRLESAAISTCQIDFNKISNPRSFRDCSYHLLRCMCRRKIRHYNSFHPLVLLFQLHSLFYAYYIRNVFIQIRNFRFFLEKFRPASANFVMA